MALPGVKINRFLRAGSTFLLLFLAACGDPAGKNHVPTPDATKPHAAAPPFNADSAFAFVKAQVDFGPRVPNSTSHVNCANWMTDLLKKYADTLIVQSYKVRAFDGKILDSRNIIASFHPELGNRILLASHWDTRPFADQDTARKNEPIDGANDGASGVGVLLEVARQLSLSRPNLGVDIILFDAEDYGQPEESGYPEMEDSYCLGSQYWAKNTHRPDYKARFGILLDMIGGQDAKFTQEGTSWQYASDVVSAVWKTAAETGFGEYFLPERTKGIIDDHYYINRLAGIKCIDIIHYDFNSRSNFWKHWHTHEDTIDKIDKNSLHAVGQTLLEVLFREVPA